MTTGRINQVARDERQDTNKRTRALKRAHTC